MKYFLLTALIALQALGMAAILRSQWRRGVYNDFIARWRGMSLLMRVLVVILVSTGGAYATNKLLGNRLHDMLSAVPGAVASLCTNVFTFAERQTGYAASAVRTNETHDLAMPDNAQLAERIARRGAHDDGFWLFDAWTNRLAREGLGLQHPIWIQTDGTITVRAPSPGIPIEELSLYTTYSNITMYAPLQSSYGFLPASRWPEFNVSRIWTDVTDRGTRVITWEGALCNRDTAQQVSFQAEFHESGDVTYRYNPAQTNYAGIGLFRNGAVLTFGLSDLLDLQDFQDLAGLTTNHLPLTTLHLSYIGDLGAGSGDTDNDGLTDWEEVKRRHTDPREADTDGDGLMDGVEVAVGSDPVSRDTDLDGLVDGSDPDPLAATPLDDFDGDGLPDAYETYWFGGTNAVDSAASFLPDGFAAGFALASGHCPTNAAEQPFLSTNRVAAWRITEGFMAQSGIATGDIYERTFRIARTGGWEQFFLSSRPDSAAGWKLEGIALDWEDSNGATGTATSSPADDSLRLDVSTNSPAFLTLRLRQTASNAACSTPLYLLAYSPAVMVGGTRRIAASKAMWEVATIREETTFGITVDRSERPCRAQPPPEELEARFVPEDGKFFLDANGTLQVNAPGAYRLPAPNLSVYAWPYPPLRGAPPSPPGETNDTWLACLDPSLTYGSGHHANGGGLLYDPESGMYSETYEYPIDSGCLWRAWHSDSSGGYECDCDPELSVGFDIGDHPDISTNVTVNGETATGKVSIGGVEVWSGTATHDRSTDDGGGTELLSDDECDDCGSCEDGNCDGLEGGGLGSLKFRIPLGVPRMGQVSGFAWFLAKEPIAIGVNTLQLASRADALVSDTMSGCTRTIACGDNRGRTLSIQPIADGVEVTVNDTVSRLLEHTWRLLNVNGSTSRIRLWKISRLNNTMSDDTYVFSNGDWTKLDNVAGTSDGLSIAETINKDGTKRVERVLRDADNAILAHMITESTRIGSFSGAVLRETYHAEKGWGDNWNESFASYYTDNDNPGRHGKIRLEWGSCRNWRFAAYDAEGRKTLSLDQCDGSECPVSQLDGFGADAFDDANVLSWLRSCDFTAVATIYGYTPQAGDAAAPSDAWEPRAESRYLVENGAVTLIGRSWTRYTHGSHGGYATVTVESIAAGAQDAGMDDLRNARRIETRYDEEASGVPLVLRGELVSATDEDGIVMACDHSIASGILATTERKSRNGVEAPTRTVTERCATYGNILREWSVHADSGIPFGETRYVYDDKNRLISTRYDDGSYTTNVYSCCRLLSSRARDGRQTLRSATTGRDHLYYAMEEVSLAELPHDSRYVPYDRTYNDDGTYRATQHFMDALGRETNTVVRTCKSPGAAVNYTWTCRGWRTSRTTAYPHGTSDYSVSTDIRGNVTTTIRTSFADRDVTETIETNKTTTATTYRNGDSVTREEWAGAGGVGGFGGAGGSPAEIVWRETRSLRDYAPDGAVVARTVTMSSDGGCVTNATTYSDFLGRTIRTVTPLSDTAYAYDGASARVLSTSDAVSGLAVTNLFNDLGETVGQIRSGVESRTDTAYEIVSNVLWRTILQTISTSNSSTSPLANSSTLVKERLTGLSNQLRGESFVFHSGALASHSHSSFDAATSVLTEVTESATSGNATTKSKYGVVIERTTGAGTTSHFFDPYGRVFHTKKDGRSVDWTGRNDYGDVVEYDTFHAWRDNVYSEFYVYDSFGNRIAVTNALGAVSTYAYDGANRLVGTGGAVYPVRHGYDTAGRRTSLSTTRDGSAWDSTAWTFDVATGLCSAKRCADGSAITYTYTADGKPLRTTYPSGRWKENAYDASRRLVTETSGGAGGSPAETNTFAYDIFDHRLSESNSVSSVTYLRDTYGNCTNETTIVATMAHVIDREFDSYGRLVRYGSTYYAYAPDGLLAAISNAEAVIEYVYTPDRLDAGHTLTLTNGTMFSRTVVRDTYRRSLITAITNSVNGVPVETFAYTYDALGRPISRNNDTFAYNDRSEVTNSIFHSPFSIFHSYGYDDIGNSTNWPANCLNQYTAIPGGPTSVSAAYDLDGNMLTNGVFSYAYDAANRLLSVSSNGTLFASFAYDSRGRRVRKVTPCATHTYFYDGWLLVRETLVTSHSSLVTDYVWGKDISGTRGGAAGIGGLLYLRRHGAIYVPRYDACGNVLGYCDAQGNVVAEYTYDAFGNTIAQSGSMAGDFAFRFSTKYFDREENLYYYGYRYYCPKLMRWLSRDPIEEEGGANLYGFCGNNATDKADFLGMAVLLVMNAKEDTYEQYIAKCVQIVKGDVEKLDKMGEKQFDKLVSCKKVAFNGKLFSGSFSEYKELVSHELISCIQVEHEYSSSISKLQSLAQKADKSYDLVAYCAHGRLWEVNESKVSVFFSDCILPQGTVIESANKAMSSAKGQKMVVSCYQTWDGKGDASKTKERLTIYMPGLNMISLKTSGNETASDNKNPSDDKKDVLNFDVIRVEKVFGVP